MMKVIFLLLTLCALPSHPLQEPYLALRGSNVTLKCELNLNAEIIYVYWEKLDENMSRQNFWVCGTSDTLFLKDKLTCTFSRDEKSTTLTLFNVTPKDNGIYQCNFVTTNGTMAYSPSYT